MKHQPDDQMAYVCRNGIQNKANKIFIPGTICLATADSSNAATRSSGDFTIMKPQGGE